MKSLKTRKLILVAAALTIAMNFPGNVFAATTTPTKAIATSIEHKWTSPSLKGAKSITSTRSTNILGTTYQVTSSSDLTNKVKYILQNRITSATLHITYSFDDSSVLDDQLSSLLDINEDNSTLVDDYVWNSITDVKYDGSGYDADYDITLNVGYVETKTQADYVENQIQTVIFPKILKSGMSDLDKEKAIHDYIISTVAYDESLTDHSDYGAIVNKSTVCQGYALLCYKMLTDAGIDSKIVVGKSDDVSHAWNMAKIAGVWYYLDCTFDDPVPDIPGRLEYNYFNKTTAEMEKDHDWNESNYPEANTEFDSSTFQTPKIDSVTFSKGKIDVETSYIDDKTPVKFALVNAADNTVVPDSSNGPNILLMDDETYISDGYYYGEYSIPAYVAEGTYKIKVTAGSQTAYSPVITVKRDSVVSVDNIADGYTGSTIPSTVTGKVSDKDGIDDVEFGLLNSDGKYVNLTTGVYDGDSSKAFDFIKLNDDGTFSKSIAALDNIPDGKYTLDISAYDNNGIETIKDITFTKGGSNSTYDWQTILNNKPWKTNYSSYGELPTLMNVAANKTFTIKFSSDVDYSNINSSNVEIVDAETGNVVASTTAKVSSSSVSVTPNANLTAGRVYYILVKNDTVKSANGKNLKQGMVCPFKVADTL